jgi:hypothetical protein
MVQGVAGHDEIDALRRQHKLLDGHGHAVQAGDAEPLGRRPHPLDHGRADVHGQHLRAAPGQWQAELPGPAAQVDDLVRRPGIDLVEEGGGHLGQPGRSVLIPASYPA